MGTTIIITPTLIGTLEILITTERVCTWDIISGDLVIMLTHIIQVIITTAISVGGMILFTVHGDTVTILTDAAMEDIMVMDIMEIHI